MLATLKEVLEKAEQGNYAVGAFNCTSLESGMAIVSAAEELKSPVILQYADSHRHLISIDVIGPIMLQLAKTAKVPVVVHLDHGASIESCRHAVDMGFTCMMRLQNHLKTMWLRREQLLNMPMKEELLWRQSWGIF